MGTGKGLVFGQASDQGGQRFEMTSPTQSRVSVVVLSCNRYRELARAIRSCMEQDYQASEVLVVDNASEPSLRTRLAASFPDVTILSLATNIGVSARNIGIEAATCDVVVTIDDDIYFDNPTALRQIVAAFARHPQAGALAFQVYSTVTGRLSRGDWCHPRTPDDDENCEFETSFINEGACAFRRRLFDTIDAYWTALFINMEGTDLTWRMFDQGWELWYVPAVRVWHSHSPVQRPSWRRYYYNPKNLILIAYRNVSYAHICQFLAPRLLLLACSSIVHGQVQYFLRGVTSGLSYVLRKRIRREPVSLMALLKWHSLRRTMPSVQARVLRNLRSTEAEMSHQ